MNNDCIAALDELLPLKDKLEQHLEEPYRRTLSADYDLLLIRCHEYLFEANAIETH